MENNTKKVYIAGKIGDLPEYEFKRNFEQAKIELINIGFLPENIVSPVDLPHDHDHEWSSYMKEDITEMMKCHFVCALKNWRHSPGATIEVNLAVSLGINIIFQR